ncbi:hypothetical protein K458DRAFT_400920 [Lentithecium fluviatile CBS 122367]|uniref:Rhodopsin domain-containing protein n=1 Tax=Lentithecium fluviatile CBS 122367 TaxID=1168545 RepID=A0A6G1JE01_9PLEO|nr:hypothetical protein K458DRAFT_400920 [Lentithecium fluviatile CBS 122367]
MSAFSPEELAYLEAHRNDSRVHEIHWVYSVPIACATISTALRLWAKRAGRNGITLDDWLIVFATGDYVFSHFYDIALVSVKLGILAFYYRVFVVPMFRKVVLATAAFVIAWGIGITVTLALACRPIEAFWDATVKGDCLQLVTFTYFTNISNLITDVWIFLMPIPVIWHLQLQTKKKLLLCLIFSIGLATCIVSAIRLTVVLGHGNPDLTWYYVPLGAYSAFEPLGGILCTNLPIIWHMYRKRRRNVNLLPGSSAFKSSDPNSTATIGSRRNRIARSLGLSNIDQTGTDSQSRTILGSEEEGQSGWSAEMQGTPQQERDKFFGKVERVKTQEVGEEKGEGSDGAPKRKSFTGPPRGGPKSPGLKKNVWEVRRK